jgi:hypothetical protein
MALDFHTTPKGCSTEIFRLSVDQHAALFDAIDQSERYPRLSAMRDYYSDASYGGDDLRALIAELRDLASSSGASAAAPETARDLQRVSEQVLSSGNPLYAVAD